VPRRKRAADRAARHRKTGIAIGLLREARLNGYRGRFYNAQALLDDLYASLADHGTARLLKCLRQMQPLLIDEIGYLTLFRLMDERYNRVSTTITDNLDLLDWYEMFQKTHSPTRCSTTCSITASPSASTDLMPAFHDTGRSY